MQQVAEDRIFSAAPKIGAGLAGTSEEGEASLPVGTWGHCVPPSIGHIVVAAVNMPALWE